MINLDGTVRSRIPMRLPVVLSVEEVKRIFNNIEGQCRLIAQIIYGGG